ncbi:hypothetical protein B0G69_7732 [Paraburkholderia sp. RAU2J]|nr:hypothetical protein B0G69_7732 [Paraburkholderia sp. RAU2J]
MARPCDSRRSPVGHDVAFARAVDMRFSCRLRSASCHSGQLGYGEHRARSMTAPAQGGKCPEPRVECSTDISQVVLAQVESAVAVNLRRSGPRGTPPVRGWVAQRVPSGLIGPFSSLDSSKRSRIPHRASCTICRPADSLQISSSANTLCSASTVSLSTHCTCQCPATRGPLSRSLPHHSASPDSPSNGPVRASIARPSTMNRGRVSC